MKLRKLPASVMVKAEFDDEAKVWIATSADVPGLVVEEESLEALLDTVGDLIPILLAENGFAAEDHEAFEMPVHIAAQAVTSRKVLIPA
jgi:tRNA pseudouridine-54 N-methylase